MIILVALTWTVTSAQRNECELGLHTCDADTQNCYNTQSTFLCLCKSGFAFSAGECHDIDECDLDSFLCPPLSGCVNSPGSYECRCVTGYELRGEACVDVDECTFQPCHEKAFCTNLDGSFTCTCDEYYAGSGLSCTQVDECASNLHNCHANALCTDINEGFACACVDGYGGDGVNCDDIDECQVKSTPCPINSSCSNTAGSFTCTCLSGYVKRGQHCVNIDECSQGTVSCPVHSKCIDTNGSYTCQCDTGFERESSGKCRDIDECTSGTHKCDTASNACDNLIGSYRCTLIDCAKLADSAQLECNRDAIFVRFPFCVFSAFDMSNWYLGGPQPNSDKPTAPSCYSQFDYNSFWFYWRAEEDDDCATTKVNNGTHITYTNTVQHVDDYGSNRIITRLRGSVITFTCIYSLDDIAMEGRIDMAQSGLINRNI